MQPIYTKYRTVGLLGGSFNPAHSGHLHITLHALKKLKLDRVWWLVSPKNPLKAQASLASYEKRLASARALASHPRIHVSDIEAVSGTLYSWKTIDFLQRRYRGTHFVWLIGADNLAQFHRWKKWQKIMSNIPVVVFDRAPYSHTSLRSKALIYSRKFRLPAAAACAPKTAPCLTFVHLKRDPISSTALRKSLGEDAFLRHNKVAGC
jgi:nicotinate-nucleotide adenylyltransferase